MSTNSLAKVQQYLHKNIKARITALLLLPMTWLVVIYLGSLAALFITSIWTVDDFTNKVIRTFTLENFIEILSDRAYLNVTIRTLLIAASVTILCALIAIPMSFFMARVVSPKLRPVLIALAITPLWASYLVKIYAWRTMMSPESGFLNWLLSPIGIKSPGYGLVSVVLALTYLWLPYMIIPIYAGMERLPNSILDASSDLGAKPFKTFFKVVLPLTYPAIIAGSIFTFSLSMGDYIAVQIVGGTFQMLGNVVYQNFALDLPFSAAVALIPVIVMVLYLTLIRKSGALENL
jgi:putative spermidine/putrescine transport system permease protein